METSIGMPAWPSVAPQHANVRLRAFRDEDAATVREMSRDEYFPAIGTLAGNASDAQALEWVERQRNRYAEGAGFSFAVADAGTDRCVGQLGLWVRELEKGRAQAGYGITPSARGHRYAASALLAAVEFAWTIPQLHRVEAYIEPWNTASIRTAELAGFEREGLLRSYLEISGRRRDLLIFGIVRES